MSEELPQKISAVLSRLSLPYLEGVNIANIVNIEGSNLSLNMGIPMEGLRAEFEQIARQACVNEGVSLDINFNTELVSGNAVNTQNRVPGVKNIIAVASGKGGVGKSTTAVNIALALAKEGASVGLLDADIYGPSQPNMLGVGGQRPEMLGQNRIKPIETLGIKLISMGNLVTEKTPMVWRGPMVSGALQQLLQQTHWEDVDYLIVDMPPGTGDIQLTLSQAVPVTASVIVTTPQNIALLDAKKGIEMFRKVNIPVLGVVENMSTHTCSNCGHTEAIFGEKGGDDLAADYDTQLLGRLPLKLSIREQTDAGKPPVVAEPSSEVSAAYIDIARKIAAGIWLQALEGQKGPEISIHDD